MKWVLSLLSLIAFMLPRFVNASSLLPLELEQGINEVSITVVNQGEADLTALAINVDKKALPQWMRILETSKRISVPRMSKGSQKLILRIEVIDAPPNVPFELPLIVNDVSEGNWEFKVNTKTSLGVPTSYELSQNYPNPFNPETTIHYALAHKGPLPTLLAIYNVLGQQVKTLVDEPQTGGFYSVQWDGKDDDGGKVSSGIYFYRLVSGEFAKTQKMLLLE